MPKNEPKTFSVDEIAFRIKKILEYDELLKNVAVEGELTQLTRNESSGHVYFSLKGQNAAISCVMFRPDAVGILMWPQQGDRVLVAGAVRFYEGRGTVQIYARKIFPLGLGAKERAKQELRRRLESEGLFAPERKRPLPSCPLVVACVTSDTGAAVHDVIRQHQNRFPAAELVVVPCLVQGVHAAESAALALRRAVTVSGVEVVLLVRGGGSKDDLDPFNDETLVREVARCPVPVVTGLGHEVDESLCDLAADMVQPTPTAAAAAVFPDRCQKRALLNEMVRNLQISAARRVKFLSGELSQTADGLSRALERRLQDEFQRLDSLGGGLERFLRNAVAGEKLRLDGFERALCALAPSNLARRGYSLVRIGTEPLLSASQCLSDSGLTIQLLDGDVTARVETISPRSPKRARKKNN